MTITIWIILGGIVLLTVVFAAFSSKVDRETARALRGGELSQLQQLLAQLPEERQPDAYNRAIRRLWDAYEREKAVPLIRDLVERHEEALIAQYWLDQLRTVEPELARSALGSEFLQNHFRPELAASCGQVG